MSERKTVWLHGSHPKNGSLQIAEYLVFIEGDRLYKNQIDCKTFHELLNYALSRVLRHAISTKKSFDIRVCHQAIVNRMNMSAAATAKCTLTWVPRSDMPDALLPAEKEAA
jgi:hypothetical protein